MWCVWLSHRLRCDDVVAVVNARRNYFLCLKKNKSYAIDFCIEAYSIWMKSIRGISTGSHTHTQIGQCKRESETETFQQQQQQARKHNPTVHICGDIYKQIIASLALFDYCRSHYLQFDACRSFVRLFYFCFCNLFVDSQVVEAYDSLPLSGLSTLLCVLFSFVLVLFRILTVDSIAKKCVSNLQTLWHSSKFFNLTFLFASCVLPYKAFWTVHSPVIAR